MFMALAHVISIEGKVVSPVSTDFTVSSASSKKISMTFMNHKCVCIESDWNNEFWMYNYNYITFAAMHAYAKVFYY